MSATKTKKARSDAARDAYLQLAAAADEFEQYANPHAVRIAAIADRIAETFHLAPHDRRSLRTAARMHDLGEVAMERDYIQRAGSLTQEERVDLERHPVIGEQEAARASAERAVQLLVRWHHEWWNGGGYPDALRQNEIPLAARILRLADTYAALTDARPYRPALTEDEARKEIVNNAGIEFDPAVVSAFLSLRDLPELESFAKPEVAEPMAKKLLVEPDSIFGSPVKETEQVSDLVLNPEEVSELMRRIEEVNKPVTRTEEVSERVAKTEEVPKPKAKPDDDFKLFSSFMK